MWKCTLSLVQFCSILTAKYSTCDIFVPELLFVFLSCRFSYVQNFYFDVIELVCKGEHVDVTLWSCLIYRAEMWSPYFLWDCDSGFRKFSTLTPTLTLEKPGLRLRAKNQTPPPTPRHNVCVLKDDLRENLILLHNSVQYYTN